MCGLVSSAGEGKSATLQATPVSLAELKVLVDAEKTSLAEAKAKLAVDVVLLDAEKERLLSLKPSWRRLWLRLARASLA